MAPPAQPDRRRRHRSFFSRQTHVKMIPLFWFHPPKTGSVLGITLASYPRSIHRSLEMHQSLNPKGVAEAVGLFRPSSELLESAYAQLRLPSETRHCCMSDWGWNGAQRAAAIRRVSDNMSVEASLGVYRGCQARMLIGHRCMQHMNLSNAQLRLALDRISNMRFAGLLSELSLSVCALNFLQTGDRFILPEQTVSFRAHKHVLRAGDHVGDEDDAVYRAAKSRFWRDVSKYGINASSCRTKDASFLGSSKSPSQLVNAIFTAPQSSYYRPARWWVRGH